MSHFVCQHALLTCGPCSVTQQTQVQFLVVPAEFSGLLGGLNREGNICPRQCVNGTRRSAHTLSLQLSVFVVSTCWRSELG